MIAALPARDIGRHPDMKADGPFSSGNAAFHLALRAAGVAHAFTDHPGGHDWTCRETHLPEARLFLSDRMRRRPD